MVQEQLLLQVDSDMVNKSYLCILMGFTYLDKIYSVGVYV